MNADKFGCTCVKGSGFQGLRVWGPSLFEPEAFTPGRSAGLLPLHPALHVCWRDKQPEAV